MIAQQISYVWILYMCINAHIMLLNVHLFIWYNTNFIIWQCHSLLLQWWFVIPDTFVPSWYFRINKFSGLLNLPSVQKRKSVPALLVRISEISGLSEPGLTNHHCISHVSDGDTANTNRSRSSSRERRPFLPTVPGPPMAGLSPSH